MVKQSTTFVTETVYGNHTFTSETVAQALETIAYKAMIDYDLELKQAGDDSFRFKINNRYDLVYSEEGGFRLVEDYDPEPFVNTTKVLRLYNKGLLYELDSGVVSLTLSLKHYPVSSFEETLERYLELAKGI